MTLTPNNRFRGLLGAGLVLAACGLAMPGCRGERTDKPPRQFIPDMDDSPKYRNQATTDFFADGRVMRPSVAGTVAFGRSMDPSDQSRPDLLAEDSVVYQGFDASKPKDAEGIPAFAPVIPGGALDRWVVSAAERGQGLSTGTPAEREAAMKAMIVRGQERFNIYCSACHGYEGDGKGLVGQKWKTPVPSFHDPKYKDRAVKTGKDGYLFSVIRHGVPNADPTKSLNMPAYADKVSIADSWAIVAYVRALQNARTDAKAEAPSSVVPAVASMSKEIVK